MSTAQGLQGKGILVTGAASGIGLATVERLLAKDAIVVGIDLAADAPAGINAYRQADVLDAEAVAAAVADVVAAAGRLDGVVHSAGVAGGGPVHLVPDEEWDRVLGINLKGTFVVNRAALAQMTQQDRADGERGSIVNLASIEGLEGTAGGSSYNASKGGVVLLTKNIAIDYGPSGIRANAICPGFIETPLLESVIGLPGLEHSRRGCATNTNFAASAGPMRWRPLRRSWFPRMPVSSAGRRSPSTAVTPQVAITGSPR